MGRASPPRASSSGNEPPAEFLDQLTTWLHSNDFSDNTITLYSDAARRWLVYARPWEERWQVRSIEWRRSMASKALKSQAVFVGAAKSFVDHLLEQKLLEGRNPFLSVKFRGLSTEYLRRRSLTDEEVQKLWASCDLKTEVGLRDHTILTIMLHTAIRIGGVAGMDIQDIEKQGDYSVVHYRGKGQRAKDRWKVLPESVLLAIKAYLKKTNRTLKDQGPLFVGAGRKLSVHGLRKSIVRRLRACGITDSAVTTHSLRHTAATKAVDQGNDLKAIQDLLDHSSLATTDRYVHSVRQVRQAAELTINYDTEKKDAKRRHKKSRPRKGT